MKRPIIGYGTDEENDWFAILDCGHCQHVRHQPPFVNRSWVTTKAGRQRFLGHELDCVRCDRLELPDAETLVQERWTSKNRADWSELEKGQWARVVPEQGQLRCQIPALDVDMQLSPAVPGIIPPQTAFRLTPGKKANFHLDMYRLLQPEE